MIHRDGLLAIFRGKREKQKEQIEPLAGWGVNSGPPYGLPPFTPHPAPHWLKAMGKNNCRQRGKIVDVGQAIMADKSSTDTGS